MNNILHIKNSEKFLIKGDSSASFTLYVETEDANVEYYLENGDYRILVYIHAGKDVCLKESGHIREGTLTISYLELEDHQFTQSCNIDVMKGSSLSVNAVHLGVNRKKVDYRLVNKEHDSSVEIANNVVSLEDSDLVMNVIGRIEKGAKRAKCHQKNRCLTIGSPKQANILPVLEIDENDVEASHSLSSGTIDDEVLFYMNARGLNRKQALSLMVSSYLMPGDEFYEGMPEGDIIRKEAERSVEELCLM